MIDWKTRCQDWEGTAAELAIVATDVLRELNIPGDDSTPNERLVRFYAQQGILQRPERRGKEAVFGYRQIVEFLTARSLIRDGWPLAKIAEFNRAADLRQLLDILPKGQGTNRAQELVSKFQKSTKAPSRAIERKTAKSAPSSLARYAELTKGRLSQRETLEALGNPAATPERDSLVRLALTSWCHVYFDPSVLHRMPAETPERLGEALKQCLIDEKIRPGDKN